jgi:hypothetical protein
MRERGNYFVKKACQMGYCLNWGCNKATASRVLFLIRVGSYDPLSEYGSLRPTEPTCESVSSHVGNNICETYPRRIGQ